MKNILGNNLKYLRKSKGLTQDQLADKIGVNRAMIGSYEEGRATPRLSVIQTLAHYFGSSLDELIGRDISSGENPSGSASAKDIAGKNLRVISTLVDRDDKELITLVPAKASAGYLNGYADPDFIETLPRLALPLPELGSERTYRAFQISGDSMEPIPSGSYIICEYVQNWHEIQSGKAYVVLTHDDGLVFKRLFPDANGELLLKSDNPLYHPYALNINTVTELWKALGYLCFNLPQPDEVSLNKLSSVVYEMKKELEELKKNQMG